MITRDITSTLLPQAEELVAKNSGINHDQLCEILLRHQFVSFSFLLIVTPIRSLLTHYNGS